MGFRGSWCDATALRSGQKPLHLRGVGNSRSAKIPAESEERGEIYGKVLGKGGKLQL
jgi:hypothetical protein